MEPASPAPTDLPALLRQQLLLAQVRLMELEDERDELAPRLTETAALLAAAQSLAEQKVGEAAHLEQVRAGLQASFDHLRHVQHETNEALNAARAEATQLAARRTELLAEVEHLHVLTRQLAEAEQRLRQQGAQLGTDLAAARTESADRLTRIGQLDTEQRAMKASRSWRWTAWLRALERLFK
jgi:predicted  nucleic acid-binding Zn-ribbon protein